MFASDEVLILCPLILEAGEKLKTFEPLRIFAGKFCTSNVCG
jgi:hypothetical protein